VTNEELRREHGAIIRALAQAARMSWHLEDRDGDLLREMVAEGTRAADRLVAEVNVKGDPTKPPCRTYCPPEMRGHWRNWHRGSGCSLDDGQPRSPGGAAEIAALGVDHAPVSP
jgi:hypothetical protein